MQLFFAPDITSPGGTLSPEESLHAVKVLRLGVGATLHLVDGRGTLHRAEITVASPRACEVRVVSSESRFGQRGYRLTMAVAPTKNNDRFEWFLEKATEIGFDAIVPILCANNERRVFNDARAEKVMISAMKQSLKAALPRLEPLTPVRELITRPFAGVKLIAHCREDLPPRQAAPATPPLQGGEFPDTQAGARVPITRVVPEGSDVLILIGPEGDFTEEEVLLALANGFIPISLGDSRLRTETAALTAVAAVYLNNLK
jgi:16S rRNA (uracil1498-N3)-methyltransferase